MKLPVRRKKTILVIIATLCVAALAYAYFVFSQQDTPQPTDSSQQNKDSQETPNTQPPTEEEVKTGEQEKNNAVQEDNPTSVALTITALNSDESFFRVRTLINNVVTGNCRLSMTKGDKTVTRTAAVQSMATSSTCAGFDIPRSELSTGTWSLSIEATTSRGAAKTSREVSL